jgi:D-alanyl-lipoteichoic acid acyltransferase DltB (MBOAT superfamily)
VELQAAYNSKRTFLFVVLMTIAVISILGPSIQSILAAAGIVPIVSIVFLKWDDRTPALRAVNIMLRACILMVLLFLGLVLFLKVQASGQLGYGDEIRWENGEMTVLGYRALLAESLRLSALAWIVAFATSYAIPSR